MARAAGLRGFRELVDDLGGDGGALLARFGIRPDSIETEDALVPADAMGWVLETAAAELRCPDFGLRLAACQDVSVLGPVAVAVASAETVGDAFGCLSRFLFTHHPSVSIGLTADPEGQPATIGISFRDASEAAGLAQVVGFAAGGIHHILGELVGGDYGLRSVHLPHAPLMRMGRYSEYFGADVRFDMGATILRVSGDLTARTLRGHNKTVHAMAMNFLERTFPAANTSMTVRVQVAIERAAKTDIATVASMLSVHERTLQRMLAAEGTTFTEVLDRVRREATFRLLSETDLSMAQIASFIGLKEQSALTRMVRRWFGATPKQVRNTARAEREGRVGVELHPSAHL